MSEAYISVALVVALFIATPHTDDEIVQVGVSVWNQVEAQVAVSNKPQQVGEYKTFKDNIRC